jgi:hypothetical protein
LIITVPCVGGETTRAPHGITWPSSSLSFGASAIVTDWPAATVAESAAARGF